MKKTSCRSSSRALGASAHAQDKTSEIDKIFRRATPATPGSAVAVSPHGKLVVNRAYGSADLERNVPISPGTILDAGSLTKQFVAAAVLLLVKDRPLSLSEDVRSYIPQLLDTGHKVTIDDLLTQTSGTRDATEDSAIRSPKSRRVDVCPASARAQFGARRGIVVFEQRLSAAETIPCADQPDVALRIHAQAPVRASRDDRRTYRHDFRIVIENRTLAYRPTKAFRSSGVGAHYDGDEIGSIFQLAAAEGSLVVCLEHSPATTLEVRPVDSDTSSGRTTVRFQRDKTRNVVATRWSATSNSCG